MYEITMKGLWVRWGSLDAPSRWLFAGSMAAFLVALAPLPIQEGLARRMAFAYDFGFYFGSGGEWPTRTATGPPALDGWAAWWFVGFSIVSALLWWRLSVRQDELFNRVQNWALAMGGAWSAAVLTVWSVFDLANIAPPVTPLAIIATFVLASCAFWIAAVRRWA